MASSTVERLASKLAEETLQLMNETGQDRLYVEVGAVLGAASQSLEEAYLTEVRVRLAASAAHRFLENKRNEARAAAPQPDAP